MHVTRKAYDKHGKASYECGPSPVADVLQHAADGQASDRRTSFGNTTKLSRDESNEQTANGVDPHDGRS